jgi:hypothetical protein
MVMAQLIIIIIVVRLLVAIIPGAMPWINSTCTRMMRRLKFRNQADLFDHTYIDPKAYYLYRFKVAPNISQIRDIDTSAAFQLIDSQKFGKPVSIYQNTYYSWPQQTLVFTKTIFVLPGSIIICLGDDWAEILFDKFGWAQASGMIDELKTLALPDKKEDFEINIISFSQMELNLKTVAITPTELDISLYYNDDFKAIDSIIRERLLTANDKGIVLLHGLPGTGKTTYLRYLIGTLSKKVMFVSPSMASNLMNPEFMDLLISNPNSVLVIEDAENIIMDRRYNSNAGVSNLLNISDGLLSDCLNVQIVCTFNSELSFVDAALLRKGRLIARYEFGKLEVAKARALAAHLELDTEINEPMTLAEITHPGEVQHQPAKVNVIGFRRAHELIEN